MKIATWNVNSLRVRQQHLLDWLAREQPDVAALQELKLQDEQFPHDALREAGYHAVCNGQKTYNGVAILSKTPAENVTRDMPGFDDPQKRVIAATINGVRVINVYVVNGEEVGSQKYEYKLRFLAALHEHLKQELATHPQLVVLGDYNIAPAAEDLHHPDKNVGSVMASEPERQAFQDLIALGLTDCFRLFPQPEKSYTWWDYRYFAFNKNLGWRIDHLLASAPLAAKCLNCRVDVAPRKLERPSDHAPVIAEYAV